MPQITLNLYATFRQYIGGRPSRELDIESGQTIGQVLEALGVPIQDARIVFCDNRQAKLDHPLKGGETVGVFPPIGGGC